MNLLLKPIDASTGAATIVRSSEKNKHAKRRRR
ncbi:hypothetical protein DSTSK_36180 [Desulforhabdus sp. TSK]|nr:hypothetical protein DSTSK_36180 [Desulforhabdus sp. TSK]